MEEAWNPDCGGLLLISLAWRTWPAAPVRGMWLMTNEVFPIQNRLLRPTASLFGYSKHGSHGTDLERHCSTVKNTRATSDGTLRPLL
jgi:hypothetical protein